MQSSYLLLNDLRIHYRHANLADGSPAVVLLHGLASNARIWDLVMPRLAEAGLAAAAPDARGHGLTDKPDGDYGFAAFGRDLIAFIDALHLEKPLLVGHSWGAMVALDYAARFTIGPRAPSGLVLVDGGMVQMDAVPNATWEQTRDRLTPPKLAGTPLEDFLGYFENPNARWQPDEDAMSIILANFETDDEERIYPRLAFENHMKIVRAMWDFRTFERFPQVRCPILLVPARPAEPQSRREAEYLALKEQGIDQIRQIAAQARVYWMEESIHDIPLQRPGELARLIIEFAAETAG